MSKKFTAIISDYPFPFNDSLKMDDVARGAAANYSLLSMDKLKQLPIKDISNDGAVWAFWVPSSLIEEGIEMIKANAFSIKQNLIWVKIKQDPFKSFISNNLKGFFKLAKTGVMGSGALDFLKKSLKEYDFNSILSFGMGRLFRQTHEICLVATNSNKIYKQLKNKSQRSVFFAFNEGHSIKPNNLHDSLDLMFPTDNTLPISKVELFARRQTKGWYCIGNESPMTKGEDIFVSLNKLILAKQEDLQELEKIILDYDSSKDKQLFDLWNKLSSK